MNLKILRQVLLAVIALILLPGVTVYVTTKLALPSSKIRQFIQVRGTELLGRAVEVGGVEVQVFPRAEIRIYDIKVANAPGFSADPVVHLPEVECALNFPSLFRLTPVINGIKVVSPEILYEVDDTGHNNLQGLGQPDTSGPQGRGTLSPDRTVTAPAAVVLKSFIIVDGKIRFHDVQSGREISVDHLNQDEMPLKFDPDLGHIVDAIRKLGRNTFQ